MKGDKELKYDVDFLQNSGDKKDIGWRQKNTKPHFLIVNSTIPIYMANIFIAIDVINALCECCYYRWKEV